MENVCMRIKSIGGFSCSLICGLFRLQCTKPFAGISLIKMWCIFPLGRKKDSLVIFFLIWNSLLWLRCYYFFIRKFKGKKSCSKQTLILTNNKVCRCFSFLNKHFSKKKSTLRRYKLAHKIEIVNLSKF